MHMRILVSICLVSGIALSLGCQRATPPAANSATVPAAEKSGAKAEAGPEKLNVPKEKAAGSEEEAVAALKGLKVRIRESVDAPLWIIELTDDDLTDQGAIREDRLNNMRALKKDVELSAVKCRFSDAGLAQLGEVPAIKNLVLSSVKVSKLDALPKLSGLKALYIEDAPVTDEGLAAAAKLKGLKGLALRSLKISDAGLAHFADLSDLVEFRISKADITSAGFRHLKGLNSLEVLQVTDCPKVSAEALEHIKGLKKLEAIEIARVPLKDDGLEHLKALISLKTLELPETEITDKGVDHLTGLTGLEVLDIRNNPKVSEASIGKLQKALPRAKIEH
jgi:Leucine-rich repeat (LRR) protein